MTDVKHTNKTRNTTDRRRQGIVREMHGMSQSLEYKRWQGILNRCYSPGDRNYAKYGANAVVVCSRWRDSFVAFHSDLGFPPREGMSIDRIDGNGHYSCGKCDECLANNWPNNVRWATHEEQNQNRGITRWITYEGRTQCLSDWAREAGQSIGAFNSRLLSGWSMKDAINTPTMDLHAQITCWGRTQSRKAWSIETGILEQTISKRIRKGWTVERALTQKVKGSKPK